MKTKLRPTKHGKWSRRKKDSLDKKMMLVRELFNLLGTDLVHGKTLPNIVFCPFYGNNRRFILSDEEPTRILINEDILKSRDLDYVVLCAICFMYTEKFPDLIKGGKVTLVDLHTCIDLTDTFAEDIFKTVAKNVAAIVLTNLLIRIIL